MSGPMLGGVKVLDLAGEAVAYAGRVLAELGADVVLVEPPGGSPLRRTPPLVEVASGAAAPSGAGAPSGAAAPSVVTVSAAFAFLGVAKRSLVLDETVPAGRRLLERLVASADVALLPDDVDEVRARAIDGPTLLALNPRLVATSVSAFGLTGPRRHWRGSDLVGWASSGSAYGMGDADRPPVAPGGGLANAASSLNAAVGAMLALRARQRTGRGQVVDISQQEAVLSVSMEAGPLLTLEGRVQQRGRRRMAAHGLFPVQDGTVEIVAFLPNQWDSMARWISEELGIEEATLEVFRGSPMERLPYFELIDTWVLDLASRYTKQAFFEEAQRRGIPCGPVNTAGDLLDDPHLQATGAWEHVRHPDVGAIRSPRGPVRFDGEPTRAGDVPALGQHTADVLADWLGVADDELDELRTSGAV